MNPYGGPGDEDEPSQPGLPRAGGRLWFPIIVVVLLGVIAVAAVSSAVAYRQVVIEQKRETCYQRLAWLNGASDFEGNGSMADENTLDARARHAKKCDGDNPLTQYDRR